MSSTTDQQIRWVLYNAETKLQSIPVNHEEIQWTVMRMKQLDWKKYYIWRDGWQNWQQLDTYLRSSQKEIHVEFKKLENEEAKDDTKTETTATVKVDRFNIETTPDKMDASQSGHVASNASIQNFDPNKKSAKPEGKPKVASKGNIFDTSRPATKNTTFVDWDDQLAKLFVESAQDFSGDSVGAATNTVNDPSRNPISFKEEKLAKKTYENRAERHTLKIEVLFINSKGKTFKSFSKNISLSGTLIDDDIPTSFFESKFEIVIINRFAKTTQNSRLQLFAKCPILSAPNRIQFIDVKDQQKAKLKSLLEQYLIDQKQMMSRAS